MNKKSVSIILAYVLLVLLVIFLGSISYAVITSYVPTEISECPDAVSVYIKDSNCNLSDFSLNFTLHNNGRFSVGGYFIHGANKSDQKLAVIDLSENVVNGGINIDNYVAFISEPNNSMKPYDEIENIFNIDDEIYSIEIIPIRFQEENNRLKLVSCGNAKIKEEINCKF